MRYRLNKNNTNMKTNTGILTPSDESCGQIIQIITGTKERHEETDDSILYTWFFVSFSQIITHSGNKNP